MNRRSFTFLLCAATGWFGSRAIADETASGIANEGPALDQEPSMGHPNVALPTLGGRQFWADEQFYRGWHIQRNTLTSHYRLLDQHNVRHAWGTLPQCQAKLAALRAAGGLPPMSGPAVIVLHGLGRSAASMGPMARYFEKSGKYTVFNVTYPTTRGSIGDHAAQLDRVIQRLEGIDELYFVAHSLGNLVLRHYLADQTADGKTPDPRIRRIVMLAPPNNGARMAEVLGRVTGFDTLAGKAAAQIRDFPQHAERLATPGCEFAIIAGGRGGTSGYNPLLSGDNDLVVSVETTRLPGASDFVLLPVIHTTMMDDHTVQQYTQRFFEQGCLVAADKRQPILRADAADRSGPAAEETLAR